MQTLNIGPSSASKLQLHVPLAIGTLQWGTTSVDHHLINSRGCISEQTAIDIVKLCQKYNVTLYDTAEGYGGGTSEKRLGRVVRVAQSDAENDSKQPEERNDSTATVTQPLFMTKFLPAPWRVTHASFESALRASNKRLGISCCPVYLIHTPVHWIRPISYWMKCAAICKKKGLLQAAGLSNCNAAQVQEAVEAGKKFGVDVVLNQVHYSLLTYNSPSLRAMELTCQKLGVSIVAYSPLGQGLLTDKLTLSPEEWDRNKPAKMLRLEYEDVIPLRECLKRLADKYSHGDGMSSSNGNHNENVKNQHQSTTTTVTMAQVALQWCIAHQTIPLVGCRSTSQARDSLGALQLRLTEKEVEELDSCALARSTLDSPKWRRMFFVGLFGAVMVVCRTLDACGFGIVKQAL